MLLNFLKFSFTILFLFFSINSKAQWNTFDKKKYVKNHIVEDQGYWISIYWDSLFHCDPMSYKIDEFHNDTIKHILYYKLRQIIDTSKNIYIPVSMTWQFWQPSLKYLPEWHVALIYSDSIVNYRVYDNRNRN